ncbi:hypothetical protein FOA19_09230 [Rufibacter hautae]|uniref:Uncharacterized protein n=1 Tax=Rufibacter hautae TaxID=2595005 RepID=A0A5B6TE88_9BACT|nr:hypothetical protein FOA19_09230 [Rufibacter hautae]
MEYSTVSPGQGLVGPSIGLGWDSLQLLPPLPPPLPPPLLPPPLPFPPPLFPPPFPFPPLPFPPPLLPPLPLSPPFEPPPDVQPFTSKETIPTVVEAFASALRVDIRLKSAAEMV